MQHKTIIFIACCLSVIYFGYVSAKCKKCLSEICPKSENNTSPKFYRLNFFLQVMYTNDMNTRLSKSRTITLVPGQLAPTCR